jgi:hypothetical protein
LTPNPSDLCNRLISAQSSTLITPSLCPRGVNIHSAPRGQYSDGIDIGRDLKPVYTANVAQVRPEFHNGTQGSPLPRADGVVKRVSRPEAGHEFPKWSLPTGESRVGLSDG